MKKAPSDIAFPDSATIVSELEFTPPRPAGARGRALPRAAPSKPERYRIINTNEVDAYEAPLRNDEAAVLGLNRVQTPGDTFSGTDRKAAKLVISTAKIEVFPDVSAVIASLPKAKPKVTNDERSARVQEEERNVRVRGSLYAASREGDNDFHFIVGDNPKRGAKVKMMTMELSGLPRDKHDPAFARMKAARDAYAKFLKGNLPGLTYAWYVPPIPVEIEGSLFYDVTHSKGPHPGPQKLQPHMPVIWEVHPISKIVFEPT